MPIGFSGWFNFFTAKAKFQWYIRTRGMISYEDEHLLVINKPAGVNTHSPSSYAGEGVYDWLRNREPRWEGLAIIHRLDKDTSGLMVFSKTKLANKSLTQQFAERAVQKRYVLQTDRAVRSDEFTIESALVKSGEKYVSRPPHAGGAEAITRFRVVSRSGEVTVLEAEPLTGRTHQIRVHAADKGLPIVGDKLYGGAPAARLFLHSARLEFAHPETKERIHFEAAADFLTDSPAAIRAAFIDSEQTNAWRMIHGVSDGWPGLYVDRLGDFLLVQSETELTNEQRAYVGILGSKAIYHKRLTRHVRQTTSTEASPRLISGDAAPEKFTIRENGLRYELSFAEGYSTGLFLDQRDNRRRLLMNYVGPGFSSFTEGRDKMHVLNTFAYTCGFSVCAAKAGANVTSLDLSKKYLDWGRRNFELNELDPGEHDFIYGDAFDWMRRLHKKQRAFDLIMLDPPTFSQSKEHGVFRAEKDYPKLVKAALLLLKPAGVLFASTNAAEWKPEDFVGTVQHAVVSSKRRVTQQHYVPQPPDFPVSRAEPAYLKTLWMRIAG